jgi:hypothetical protein
MNKARVKLSLHFPLSCYVEISLSLASSWNCSCLDKKNIRSAGRMGIIWHRISQSRFFTLNLTFILVPLSPPGSFFVALKLCKPSNQPWSPTHDREWGSNHKEQFCNLRLSPRYFNLVAEQNTGKKKKTIKSKLQTVFLLISYLCLNACSE